MIFETIFENKFGAEIDLPSPQEGFKFKMMEGDRQIFRSTDPLGVFSRYERIVFLKGHEQYIKSTTDPSLMTRKLLWRGLKCIVRKDWQEPTRAWPTIWMLNQSDCPLQVISPDMFNPQRKVFLFWDLPVLCSVPCYSSFAEYKKYVIGVPDRQTKQVPGARPGADFDLLENNVLEGKRSPQELTRLQKMVNNWKEEQRGLIKVI